MWAATSSNGTGFSIHWALRSPYWFASPACVTWRPRRRISTTAPTLSEAVRAMGIAQLDRVLTDQQIAAIVAFLDTLTGTYRREVTDTPRAATALL
jgi:cytochrome c peroxidase